MQLLFGLSYIFCIRAFGASDEIYYISGGAAVRSRNADGSVVGCSNCGGSGDVLAGFAFLVMAWSGSIWCVLGLRKFASGDEVSKVQCLFEG